MNGRVLITVFVATMIAVATFISWRIAKRFGEMELERVAAEAKRPGVTGVRPAAGDSAVLPNAFVACDVNLPNTGAGIDVATMSAKSVRLFKGTDRKAPIAAKLNSSGAGDAIVLQPEAELEPNTAYHFEVTDQLKDTSGAAFKPFRSEFKTSSATKQEIPIAFEKVPMPHTSLTMPGTDAPSAYTALTFGPDGKLYAATFDGRIMRFTVDESTGILGEAETISSIQRENQGPRIITGLAFDPTSVAPNLVLWVGHGQMAFNEGRIEGAEDWTGKISVLVGPSLSICRDVVIGLPRAWKDHMTFQLVFGPDGALYFCQGSHTSVGAPDKKWNFREERTLTAACLRLDVPRMRAEARKIDVKTADGGSYDPSQPDSMLTIYATGIRSGFDLLWHSNGRLYTGLNGAAAGGNAPAGESHGQKVPAINDIAETTHDLLLSIERGGYYGHPNPARGEFVLMGGNPTDGVDVQEIKSYPVGTKPEPNFKSPAFDFGLNVSPNGLCEFRSNGKLFNGQLDGCILVTRYSGGKDVIVLRPAADGTIAEVITGITGFTGFADPLDIVQHSRTGVLYVAEYSGRQITLLRPSTGSSAVYRQDP